MDFLRCGANYRILMTWHPKDKLSKKGSAWVRKWTSYRDATLRKKISCQTYFSKFFFTKSQQVFPCFSLRPRTFWGEARWNGAVPPSLSRTLSWSLTMTWFLRPVDRWLWRSSRRTSPGTWRIPAVIILIKSLHVHWYYYEAALFGNETALWARIFVRRVGGSVGWSVCH